MTDGFRPHPVEWTPEKVGRFWDWLGSQPALREEYFSRKLGGAILREVSRHVPLRGAAVDFGCGPGDLTGHLLNRGVRTLAVDSSPESIATVATRFAGEASFAGASVLVEGRAPLGDGEADVAFFVETIEHLEDDLVTASLAEIRRILRPGGHLVITTPNEENLAKSRTLCPDCGAVFHTVQHVRAWSASSLLATVKAAGFTPILCGPTLFSELPRALRPFQRLKYTVTRAPLPHLVLIGVKG